MTQHNIFENREMRTFFNGLATEVQTIHGNRCPCCLSPMVKPRKNNDANRRRRDKITVAHDRPVGFGGNQESWVYACQGCNTDQMNRTFRAWSFDLRRTGDRRADLVSALADRIDAYNRRQPSAHKLPKPVPAQTDELFDGAAAPA
jgi:hypothetical protein